MKVYIRLLSTYVNNVNTKSINKYEFWWRLGFISTAKDGGEGKYERRQVSLQGFEDRCGCIRWLRTIPYKTHYLYLVTYLFNTVPKLFCWLAHFLKHVAGVESAALKGDDKCQIEVIGNGIDAVQLTTLLRKGVGYTELMTVGAADEKKPEEKKTEEAKMQAMPVWHMWEVSNPAIPVYSYQQEPPCNILWSSDHLQGRRHRDKPSLFIRIYNLNQLLCFTSPFFPLQLREIFSGDYFAELSFDSI